MENIKDIENVELNKDNQSKLVEVTILDDITVVIDTEVVNDWDFLELISEVEEKPFQVVKLLKFLFGESYESLKELIKSKYGRVSSEVMLKAYRQLMENDALKK